MTDKNVVFGGSIPERYDRFMGPVLFDPYARDLAARLPANAARVLELACGTGIVTRRLREAMRAGSTLTATDLAEPMVAFARTKVPAAGTGARVEFRTADAAALPFGDAEFDTVACQFGLMFVPDKAAAVREAKRVLAPGGTFLFNVWDSMAENPTARLAHETVRALYPTDPPDFYTVPFGFSDAAIWRGLLDGAGFAEATVEHVALEARSPTARDFATGLVTGSPMATAIADRGTLTAAAVVDAVAAALGSAFGTAPMVAPMRALVFRAVASKRN